MATTTTTMSMAMLKLALVILVAAFLAGTTNGDCDYHFKVKTGDWPGDGTQASVDFSLYGDSQGAGGPIVGHKKFSFTESGSTDEFSFTDPKCIRPCRLVLSIDDSSGERQDWHCQSVNVAVSGDISYSKSFYVDQLVDSVERPIQIDQCTDAVA